MLSKWRVRAELLLSPYTNSTMTVVAKNEDEAFNKAKAHLENKYPGSIPLIKLVERID